MLNLIRYSVLILVCALACSTWASDIGDCNSPFADVWDDTGLWHFNSYFDTALTAGYMLVPDDDNAFATRNADIAFYDGSTQLTSASTTPKLVDPNVEGIGYPDANSAFGKCVFFDGVNDNARVAMSKVPVDATNLLISCWIRLPSDYVPTTGADRNMYYIDRWNQIAFRMINLSSGQMQNQVVLWNANNVMLYLTFTYDGSGIDPKQWHNVALRCSGNDVKFYINGVLQQTLTLSTQGIYTTPNQSNMYVGSKYTLTEAFKGYLDELRITKAVPQAPLKGYSNFDFNQDCIVDVNDLKGFVDHWLETGTGCQATVVPMDFNGNCVVDIGDFAIFAQNWLICSDAAGLQCANGL